MAGDSSERVRQGSGDGGPGTSHLTPADVQAKVFKGQWGFRGYHEGQVDEFLDLVTEELARLHAENTRLLEELADARAGRGEAPEPEPAASGASGSTALPRFIAREREFLQSLAGLVQRHAEAVKGDLRRAREEAAGSSVSPAPEVEAPAARPPAPGATAPHEVSTEEETAGEPDGQTRGLSLVPPVGGAEPVVAGAAGRAQAVGALAAEAAPEVLPLAGAPVPDVALKRFDPDQEPAPARLGPPAGGAGGVELPGYGYVADPPWREGAGGAEPTPGLRAKPEPTLRELFWGEE